MIGDGANDCVIIIGINDNNRLLLNRLILGYLLPNQMPRTLLPTPAMIKVSPV